jgi:hypothetical protein
MVTVSSSSASLASYLVTGRRDEVAKLAALRGFATGDLSAAFRQEEFRARGTKAAAGFFHCYFAPSPCRLPFAIIPERAQVGGYGGAQLVDRHAVALDRVAGDPRQPVGSHLPRD